MASVKLLSKPSNARWRAKAAVSPDGELNVCPADDDEIADLALPPQIEIAWYEGGRIKVTIPAYCPAVIRQAYLTGEGRDTIVELAPRTDA
jgi:hypothetical protein